MLNHTNPKIDGEMCNEVEHNLNLFLWYIKSKMAATPET